MSIRAQLVAAFLDVADVKLLEPIGQSGLGPLGYGMICQGGLSVRSLVSIRVLRVSHSASLVVSGCDIPIARLVKSPDPMPIQFGWDGMKCRRGEARGTSGNEIPKSKFQVSGIRFGAVVGSITVEQRMSEVRSKTARMKNKK